MAHGRASRLFPYTTLFRSRAMHLWQDALRGSRLLFPRRAQRRFSNAPGLPRLLRSSVVNRGARRKPCQHNEEDHMTKALARSLRALAAGAAIAAAPLAAQAAQFINILTGGTSGVYYPIGVARSKIYGEKIEGARTQVQATKASVEN